MCVFFIKSNFLPEMGVTGLSKKIRPRNGATNNSFEELTKSDETKTIMVLMQMQSLSHA